MAPGLGDVGHPIPEFARHGPIRAIGPCRTVENELKKKGGTPGPLPTLTSIGIHSEEGTGPHRASVGPRASPFFLTRDA